MEFFVLYLFVMLEAEAEKIAGADTKVAEREAEMLESQSEFNRRMTKLQDSIE